MSSKLAIHSVPRSGSSWLGELFNSHPNVNYKYQPFFSFQFRDRIDLQSTASDVKKFFRDLDISHGDFIDQNENRNLGYLPKFKKKNETSLLVYKEVRFHFLLNHLLKCESDLKLIGLVRNPLSVINSWHNAPREFRSDLDWNLSEEWLSATKKNENKPENYFGYLKWKEFALKLLELQNRFPERIRILKYSDLTKSTEQIMNELLKFVDLEMADETKMFIRKSKTKHDSMPYSVFKKIDSDNKWENQLESNIVDAILTDVYHSDLGYFLD